VKPIFGVIVVIPVGPNSVIEFVKDTVDSFTFYTGSSYKIIFVDDSHQGLGDQLKNIFPEADIIRSEKPMGGWAGLYLMLARAFHHALENYHFDVLLKLDTDALVIGSYPEREALNLFKADPRTGIAGQYPNDYDGKPWDVGWPRDRVLNGATTWRFIKRPIANIFLRKEYLKAIKNGYRAGESVFGGAYFMSKALLVALAQNRSLPNYNFRTLNMGEDHLFGLLAKAVGFHLGDLSSGSLPFACAWKGLPASPEELMKKGKKIIHSTRNWQNLKEEEIRTWFKEERSTHSKPSVASA
jgi:hypothetical protein